MSDLKMKDDFIKVNEGIDNLHRVNKLIKPSKKLF